MNRVTTYYSQPKAAQQAYSFAQARYRTKPDIEHAESDNKIASSSAEVETFYIPIELLPRGRNTLLILWPRFVVFISTRAILSMLYHLLHMPLLLREPCNQKTNERTPSGSCVRTPCHMID